MAASSGLEAVENLARRAETMAHELRDASRALSRSADGLEWRSPAADQMRGRVGERGSAADRLAVQLETVAQELRLHGREAAARAAAIEQAIAAAGQAVSTLPSTLTAARP